MTLDEAMKQLQLLGNERMRAHNAKYGAGDKQFGVKMGDIRALAKKIKTNPKLAHALWKTKNLDAQFLAVLLFKPKELSPEEVDGLVRTATYPAVTDWLISYVIKLHPEKEALRQKWMTDPQPMAARAGWSLTAERVEKSPKGLDFDALLDRIEREMPNASKEPQWTMNSTLAKIGIHSPKHRPRAIAIGESLGIYQDYPVSKGCTSPFAPVWINAMVVRQAAAVAE